jgi:hypothetical protein
MTSILSSIKFGSGAQKEVIRAPTISNTVVVLALDLVLVVE